MPEPDNTLRPPRSIGTRRLVLRRPRLADAGGLFRTYASDPRITRYLSWRAHESARETRAFLRRAIHDWRAGGHFPFVIERRRCDGPIGVIGFVLDGHRALLGFAIGRRYQGQGYMTEAVDALTGWLAGQPHVHRIWAICHPDNAASVRVLEKCGLRREGRLRAWYHFPNISPEPQDVLSFSLVPRRPRGGKPRDAVGRRPRDPLGS